MNIIRTSTIASSAVPPPIDTASADAASRVIYTAVLADLAQCRPNSPPLIGRVSPVTQKTR